MRTWLASVAIVLASLLPAKPANDDLLDRSNEKSPDATNRKPTREANGKTNGEANEHRGIVRPMRWSRVATAVGGRVAKRLAEEHDIVGKDTVVVRLDDTLARADLKSSEAKELEARARHRLATLDLERQRRLQDRGAADQATLDRAAAEEQATRAAVLGAEASVRRAEYRLARTAVTAPFAGLVGRIDVEIGEYVAPGRLLFTLMEVDRVKIESFLDADAAEQVDAGDTVELLMDDGNVTAKVRSVAAGTDNAARTFKVVIVAGNPADERGRRLFRPGIDLRWRKKVTR